MSRAAPPAGAERRSGGFRCRRLDRFPCSVRSRPAAQRIGGAATVVLPAPTPCRRPRIPSGVCAGTNGLVYGVEQRHLLRRARAIARRSATACRRGKQFGIRQASITADHGAERVNHVVLGNLLHHFAGAHRPSCSLSRGNEMPLSAGRSGRDSEPGLPRAEIIAASESGS